jgi:hypothetical protein
MWAQAAICSGAVEMAVEPRLTDEEFDRRAELFRQCREIAQLSNEAERFRTEASR